MPQKEKFPILATALTAYRDIFGSPANFLRMIAFSLALMFFLIDIPTHFISQEVSAAMEAHKAAQASAPKPQLPPDMPPEVAEQAAKALANLPQEQPQIKAEYLVVGMALNLLQVMIVFSLAVALYRRFLLGAPKDKIILFRFGKMELDYSWTSVKTAFVLLPLLLIAVALAFSLIMPQPGETSGPETYAFIAIGVLASLYLQARLSIAYPLTVMGDAEPVKKSWKLTGRYGVQLAIGQVLIVVPMMVVMLGFVFAASALIEHFRPDALDTHRELPLFAALLLKAIGSLFTLSVFAALVAFQARAYGFLVNRG